MYALLQRFTGPLTPVMRKYLNVKPQNLPSKAIELPRPFSAQEKSKRRPPVKSALAASTSAVPAKVSSSARGIKPHVRSANSNAIVAAGSMQPPASIPSQARIAPRPQTQHTKPNDHQSEQHSDYERQRVLSTGSSTFSIKSAPSNLPHAYQHRPPVRLATSQSQAKTANSLMAASSGQARRVRRVEAVEPHPANQPDFSTMAPKTPIRPMALAGVGFPMQKLTRVPGKDLVGISQGVLASAPGVVFPTSGSESAPTAIERKGAQRVPKPKLPSSPPKGERPETAMSDNVKGVEKPSIFRRGAPDAKKNEKPKEGFVPRRGGGVTQPTLSQLSKQRTLPPTSGATAPVRGKAASTSVTSKRPVWGTGTRPAALKGLPRVVSRNGIAKVPAAKQDESVTGSEVQPAMVPLPESPAVVEKNCVPLAAPSSSSSQAPQVDEEETQEAGTLEEVTTEEVTTEESSEVAQGSTETEANPEIQTDKSQEVAQDPSDEDIQDVLSNETDPPPPHTPPYPSTEEESDEDDLDAIEFATGNVYDSAGAPIKIPGKVVHAATGDLPERNPLAEVVVNG